MCTEKQKHVEDMCMNTNNNYAPEKLYLHPTANGKVGASWLTFPLTNEDVEYTRTDAFIEKVINFLNYKLDDVVAIRVPDTIIPHPIAKQELIEDLKKHIKEY